MTVQSVFISALTCVLLGCSGSSSPPDEPAFRHDVSGDVRPWTNEAFDSADDKFTFAVFSDLTGGEREEIFEIVDAQRKYITIDFFLKQIRAQDKDFDPDHLKEYIEYLSVLEIALMAPPGMNIKKSIKK